MSTRMIRTRYFLAVEGEGEQSFVKWLQQLCDNEGLHVHLDCQPLGGGGYKSMLNNARHYQQRNQRRRARASFLLVDEDRAEYDDGWSLSRLQQEASQHKFTVCVQRPNQEGILIRMMPGKETLRLNATTVKKELRVLWSEYRKPVDARTLSSRFSITDLLRAARCDTELKKLLVAIGLFH